MAESNRSFVTTDTILDKILAHKQEEVAACKAGVSLAQLMNDVRSVEPPRDMIAGLRRDSVALIAEVKRASPSKGVLIEDFRPVDLAMTYEQHGASAISVLTDERFFQGHLDYLTAIHDKVKIPVLRKDFVIDPYQVYEGRTAGADAILLIVGALYDSQLAELYKVATDLGMTALVEVHDEAEMERALKIGATLIGINNRDLKTFNEDLGTTERLAKLAPKEVTLVAESAIRSVDDVRKMGELGAHAVLVGEGLVKAGNIGEKVREFSSQRREPLPPAPSPYTERGRKATM
jgi:indole-3-glycerol phosphate synthase